MADHIPVEIDTESGMVGFEVDGFRRYEAGDFNTALKEFKRDVSMQGRLTGINENLNTLAVNPFTNAFGSNKQRNLEARRGTLANIRTQKKTLANAGQKYIPGTGFLGIGKTKTAAYSALKEQSTQARLGAKDLELQRRMSNKASTQRAREIEGKKEQYKKECGWGYKYTTGKYEKVPAFTRRGCSAREIEARFAQANAMNRNARISPFNKEKDAIMARREAAKARVREEAAAAERNAGRKFLEEQGLGYGGSRSTRKNRKH
jgi:hypothetical protein